MSVGFPSLEGSNKPGSFTYMSPEPFTKIS